MFDNVQQPLSQQQQIQMMEQLEAMTQPQPQVVQASRVPKSSQQNSNQPVSIFVTKDYYTDAEWTARKNEYKRMIDDIKLDYASMSPSMISENAIKIDTILTPLKIDDNQMQNKAFIYEFKIKTSKELYFNLVKNNLEKNGIKATVDVTASAVADKISKDVYEDGLNAYDLFEKYHVRANDTKSLISILEMKKDFLITHTGALKIEASVGSFTQNVMPQQQFNNMKG